MKDYYIGTFGASVASYDQEYLKNTTPPPAESGNYEPWYSILPNVMLWEFEMQHLMNRQWPIVYVAYAFNYWFYLAYRLWWYQVCSEVAYFQVAPKNDSVRSAKIDTRLLDLLSSNKYSTGSYLTLSI